MKDFNDLVFNVHPVFAGGYHAVMDFDNGYGVSVVNGQGSYTNGPDQYEVAILKDGALCYDTPITDDVIGYNTQDDVTIIMKTCQQL